MKKVFKLADLDCANCAAKMETSIKKLPNVQNASISFMSQRLTLEADEAQFPHILNDVQQIIRKIEPHCKIIR